MFQHMSLVVGEAPSHLQKSAHFPYPHWVLFPYPHWLLQMSLLVWVENKLGPAPPTMHQLQYQYPTAPLGFHVCPPWLLKGAEAFMGSVIWASGDTCETSAAGRLPAGAGRMPASSGWKPASAGIDDDTAVDVGS